MEEKKLTDEEIVKALKFAIEQKEADWIGYWNEKYQWIEFPMKDVLDLINRLKAENKGLENLCNKTYDDLTKEIERLTEENDQTKDLLTNTVNELEKLKIENRFVNSYRTRIQELQKQVDECENRVSAAYELGYKESKLSIVKDTAKEIYAQVLEWSPVGEDYHCFITNLENWLKEKYGVEVE